MAISIDGSNNTIGGLAVGGLPDGIVDADMIAANAITTAKIGNDQVTTAKSSGTSKGITHARSYRITTTFATAGDNSADLTANWAFSDLNIGSGFSLPSSGLFTFPTTGIYEVNFQTLMYAPNGTNAPYVGFEIQMTVDGGSNFSTAAVNYQSQSDDLAANRWYGCNATCFIDCTSTTNVKFKVVYYRTAGYGNVNFYASNTNDATGLYIKRIGDT